MAIKLAKVKNTQTYSKDRAMDYRAIKTEQLTAGQWTAGQSRRGNWDGGSTAMGLSGDVMWGGDMGGD